MTTRSVVADTETTGLSVDGGDRIVEIGLVELVNRQPTGRVFHKYIYPQRDVPQDAINIHGLTNEFLKDKPTFDQVADEMAQFIDGAELVIHNAQFDLSFLNFELANCGKPALNCKGVVDTLEYIRLLEPGRKASLDSLCDRYGVRRDARTLHGALLDAQLLSEVYVNMTRRQSDLGLIQHPLPEELQAMDDLRQLALTVVNASEAETAAHEAYLAAMEADKAGAPAIWNRLSMGSK